MENSETTTSSAKVTAVDAASQRSQETKEALLRWQREQFTQRAELAKMQALAQDTSHPNEEPRNTSAYMGLPASVHVFVCTYLPLGCDLPLFVFVETALWSALGTAHACWHCCTCLKHLADSRSWEWRRLLPPRPTPYPTCHDMFKAPGVYCIAPYRMHLRTCLTRRGALIVIRLCVGLLLLLWSALLGACLCGLSDVWNVVRIQYPSTTQTRQCWQPPNFCCNDHTRLPVRKNTRTNPHTTRSCPGLNPRGDRTWAPSLLSDFFS